MPIHVFPCLPRICSGPDSDDICVPQITKKHPSQLKSSSNHGNMGAANGFPWLMFRYFSRAFLICRYDHSCNKNSNDALCWVGFDQSNGKILAKKLGVPGSSAKGNLQNNIGVLLGIALSAPPADTKCWGAFTCHPASHRPWADRAPIGHLRDGARWIDVVDIQFHFSTKTWRVMSWHSFERPASHGAFSFSLTRLPCFGEKQYQTTSDSNQKHKKCREIVKQVKQYPQTHASHGYMIWLGFEFFNEWLHCRTHTLYKLLLKSHVYPYYGPTVLGIVRFLATLLRSELRWLLCTPGVF